MIKNKLILFLGVLILAMSFPATSFCGAGYNDSPAFHDLSSMSSQELAAEMRYIIKMKQEKKFYPQTRIDQVEAALVKKQMDEMKSYESKLKQEAAEAKRLQDLKDMAYEKAKEQVEKQYEKNEEKIKEKAEEIIRDQVGPDRYDKAKDMYEKMEKQGTEYYEKNLKDYADKATKAYDYYNKYQDAKKSITEAPEAAKNLLGALAITGEALKELGGKLEDTPTPLKIVGQALTAYGEACGLGETGAKVYTRAVHGGDNTVNSGHNTIYTTGMEKNNVIEMERSALQQFDKNLKIFELHDGRAIVFDESGKPISGPNGDIMSKEEYQKMQEAYSAWQSMKKGDWPELSSEDLVKLATGQKANITLNDRIWLSDEKKDFGFQDILDKANEAMKSAQRDTLIKEIDDMTKGTRDFLDGWRQGARNLDISKLFNDYLDHTRASDPEWYKKSDIEQMGNFKDLIEKLLKTGRNWNEVKDYIKNMKEKDKDAKDKEKDKNDPAKDRVKDKLGLNDKNKNKDKDKDKDKPGSNDKNAKDKIGTAGKKYPTKDKEHWTQKNKDDFGGGRDKGFTKTGGETYRPVSDPFALGMPVLKPNIYLYPIKTENVTVTFEYPENVTESIPYYNPSAGWQVKVTPFGEIDGKYSFLFYEANVLRQFFQKNNGWTIPTSGRPEKFTEILNLYGFNQMEKDDFIEFWNEKLEKDKVYIAYPQETRILNNAMPVEIEPGPDSVHRIWFYFIEAGDRQALTPGISEVITRKGFTAVEWGGMVE